MYQRGSDTSPCFPVVRIQNPQANDTLLWNTSQQMFLNSQAITPSPGTVAVVTDSTLTGSGTTTSPLHVVPPATGSVAVVTDTTLTGNGTTGSPLHVVPPAAGSVGVVTNTTLTGNGTTGSPLSLQTTGVTAGTYSTPLDLTVNNYGSLTTITPTIYSSSIDMCVSATMSIPNSTYIALDAVSLNGNFKNKYNSTTFQIGLGQFQSNVAGMMIGNCSIEWPVNGTGYRRLYANVTNSANPSALIIAEDWNNNPSAANTTTNNVTTSIYVGASSDTLQFVVYQTSGAAQTVTYNMSWIYLHP